MKYCSSDLEETDLLRGGDSDSDDEHNIYDYKRHILFKVYTCLQDKIRDQVVRYHGIEENSQNVVFYHDLEPQYFRENKLMMHSDVYFNNFKYFRDHHTVILSFELGIDDNGEGMKELLKRFIVINDLEPEIKIILHIKKCFPLDRDHWRFKLPDHLLRKLQIVGFIFDTDYIAHDCPLSYHQIIDILPVISVAWLTKPIVTVFCIGEKVRLKEDVALIQLPNVKYHGFESYDIDLQYRWGKYFLSNFNTKIEKLVLRNFLMGTISIKFLFPNLKELYLIGYHDLPLSIFDINKAISRDGLLIKILSYYNVWNHQPKIDHIGDSFKLWISNERNDQKSCVSYTKTRQEVTLVEFEPHYHSNLDYLQGREFSWEFLSIYVTTEEMSEEDHKTIKERDEALARQRNEC
ncbi:hypothetical protein DFJ63DRAFT_314780 [Scheffersomyces coipomensis]|uniref:uncharacterized protein n=1 Tax=Scheffersomyces coipomensis TaxID=1788519 RepID=UPI00315D22C3